ncbi:hypothetical protein HYH02_003597 [Chlamydomonas schloesseri]|uniref:Major facilitator superfamily (MFS) profile domain-containing protein n=1 Tax=Chlamydomonas schloesseri TaxID=2026947 RepID=A0A836B9I3_9CHLO|nr:hypothetical protein HYH02_003597 [Chlamydomonas schloesseri]|eukprot:KAG2451821.1 hypothetical protein HYH02_003597 [Chlamydomonas schloesseri]
MVFLLLYSVGLAIMFPITPTLVTNGFASLAAGRRMDCTAYPPHASPPECVDAHSTAVTWMSWTNFVSSSLLTFLCAPYVGALSDRLGRKPFMLVGISLTFLPLAALQAFLHDLLPVYWYYPASAVGGVVSSFTMTLTAVADLLEQRHRATAVGYLTSCFSVGMLVGPLLGGYMSCTTAMWACIGGTAVTLAYVAVFVPECAPEPLARRAARKAKAAAAKRAAAPGASSGSLPASGGKAGDEEVEAAEAGRPREAAGHSMSRAWAEQEAEQEQAAEEEAVAETVSLLSAQQHMMGGAVAVAPGTVAAAPAGECVYGCAGDGSGHHPQHHGDDISSSSKHGAAHTHRHDHDPAAPPTLSAKAGSKAGAGDASTSSRGSGAAGSSCSGNGGGGGAGKPSLLSGMAAGWDVIRGSSFYRRIALIWVVVSMTWEGAGELLMQYLQLRLGFNTRDQAHVLVVLASGGLVVKLGLLALLVRWLGERRLLAFGLLAYACECLALAAAHTKPLGLAAVSVGSLASVCWPALVALQTAGVAPGQQGAVFGALQAISSMASGLGPLLFAAVFRAVTRTDSKLPKMPGVVWCMAAGMTAVAIGLTLSLPQPASVASGAGGADASHSHKSRGGRDEAVVADEPVVVVAASAARQREEGGSSGIREPLLS